MRLPGRRSGLRRCAGSAVNNDGSVRVSYTAPGLGGQTEVIAQALSNAAIDVETVGYVEAQRYGHHAG